MIKTELEYCMKCGNENPQDREICECGGRNFVFGNKFKYINKKVVCDCGNDKFQMTMHFNMSPIYTRNYKCSGCGNIIGMQTYCENTFED